MRDSEFQPYEEYGIRPREFMEPSPEHLPQTEITLTQEQLTYSEMGETPPIAAGAEETAAPTGEGSRQADAPPETKRRRAVTAGGGGAMQFLAMGLATVTTVSAVSVASNGAWLPELAQAVQAVVEVFDRPMVQSKQGISLETLGLVAREGLAALDESSGGGGSGDPSGELPSVEPPPVEPPPVEPPPVEPPPVEPPPVEPPPVEPPPVEPPPVEPPPVEPPPVEPPPVEPPPVEPPPVEPPPVEPPDSGGGSSSHSHSYDQWTVETPATCGVAGLESRTCAGCARKETRPIPATGAHTLTTATTDGAGGHTGTCDVCGQGATMAHTPDTAWTTDGNNHWHVCTVCGTEMESVAHTFAWRDKGQTHAEYCTVCNYEKTAAAHILTAATTAGETEHTGSCDVCRLSITMAHTPDTTWTTDGSDHWHTCTLCVQVLGKTAHNLDEASMKNNSPQPNHTGTCVDCGTGNIVQGHIEKAAWIDDTMHSLKCPCGGGMGAMVNHTVTQWTPDANGTQHTGTCTLCQGVARGAHAYTDGVCVTCGASKAVLTPAIGVGADGMLTYSYSTVTGATRCPIQVSVDGQTWTETGSDFLEGKRVEAVINQYYRYYAVTADGTYYSRVIQYLGSEIPVA